MFEGCASDQVAANRSGRPIGGISEAHCCEICQMTCPFEQSPNFFLDKRATIPEGMAHLEGIDSNGLFGVLSQWNEILSATQLPTNDPERAVCGVAR